MECVYVKVDTLEMNVERPNVLIVVVVMVNVVTSSVDVTLVGNMLTAVCVSVSTTVNKVATVKMALVSVHLVMVAMTVVRKYALMIVQVMAVVGIDNVTVKKAFQEKTVLSRNVLSV